MKKMIILAAMFLTLGAAAQKPACKGTTAKGEACKSTIILKSGYCRVHDPATPRCGASTSKDQPCRMVVAKTGDKCKHHKSK